MGARLQVLIAIALVADASANECKIVQLDFTPAELVAPEGATPEKSIQPSQIVAWIEDTAGNYVDTIFITQSVGSFGIGNRPGRYDFNSGPKWPYGRRTTVFPIWAHRRAASGAPTWQELVFQDRDDDNLSHAAQQSTIDRHFCRPQMSTEAAWDMGTCATVNTGTDKGVFGTNTSLYPPRNDITRLQYDSPSVDSFAMLNPFDAVSAATPPSGAPATIGWPIPSSLPNGNYVLWFEIAREFDHNATYSIAAYPKPTGIPWADYGEAYRGQPSVLYQVPFTIGPPMAVFDTLDYVGYGAPDGLDGNVRPPDTTITTDVPGSGALRLAMRPDGSRLRVTSFREVDNLAPAAPIALGVNTLTRSSATIEFTAPGDDGLVGKVRAYEISYAFGPTLEHAIDLKPQLAIGEGGEHQEFTLSGLLYDTEYTVGIRAVDNCGNTGALATYTFRTPDRGGGEVDACFIATAAYGTILANDVEPLRSFRDRVLSSTVLGELAIEAYYTFGPAAAGVIGESDVLRAIARGVLQPLLVIARRHGDLARDHHGD